MIGKGKRYCLPFSFVSTVRYISSKLVQRVIEKKGKKNKETKEHNTTAVGKWLPLVFAFLLQAIV